MQLIRKEFLLRLNEIDDMLSFLLDLEAYYIKNINGGLIGVSINTSLKSSVVLMLYNLIESTLTNTLKRLHERINSHGVMFSDANKEIRQLAITYYHSMALKKTDVHSSSESLEELICRIIEKQPLDISFESLSKQYPLYSGNIDAKLIRKILKRYGLSITDQSTELNSIKKYRNQLAHGERTFEECGREIPLPRLKTMRDRTYEFIDDMISQVDSFCLNKKFLSNQNVITTPSVQNFNRLSFIKEKVLSFLR